MSSSPENTASSSFSTRKNRAFFGLLRRYEIWLPTPTAVVLGLVLLALGSIFILPQVHSFLSPTEPIPSKYLVVEGWIPDHATQAALKEFQKGGYEKIFVTGGPLGTGAPLAEYGSFAELGARVLVKLGAPREKVKAVPAPKVSRDRTYASAVALRDLLAASRESVNSINVVSVGAHARRTRFLFGKAFGESTRIGIISIPNLDYDPHRWWLSSAGFREVSGEFIAVFYASVFFRAP